MNQSKRFNILNRFQQYNSNPKIELFYRSPFELLIAVLLSAQSTDYQVNRVTNSLFRIANTPQAMLDLGINGIKKYIKSVGLYNNKAKYIFNASRLLVEYYDGVVPNNRLALESLPGIGRKSASIVLSIVFGLPTIAVDTHVFRFCNRSRFALGKNVQAVESKLLRVVSRNFRSRCHYWFVLHGRYICRAKRPICCTCFIRDLCEFSDKIL